MEGIFKCLQCEQYRECYIGIYGDDDWTLCLECAIFNYVNDYLEDHPFEDEMVDDATGKE